MVVRYNGWRYGIVDGGVWYSGWRYGTADGSMWLAASLTIDGAMAWRMAGWYCGWRHHIRWYSISDSRMVFVDGGSRVAAWYRGRPYRETNELLSLIHI